jgi:hypothetical protein
MPDDLTAWAVFIIALAAYRLTRFLVFDSLFGFNLASRSRMSGRLDRWAYTTDGKDRTYWRGKLADLLVCPYCTGFWVTIGVWASWFYGPTWLRVIVVLFAIAGVQAFLNHLDQR